MEDNCTVIKNEVTESPDLYNLEDIKEIFITSPKLEAENHDDGYVRKYATDLESHPFCKTEGSEQYIKPTLPEIEHFMSVTENSESYINKRFSNISSINGTTSVYSTNEDVASSGSSHNKEKAPNEDRPLPCDICGKYYNCKKYLTRHKRIHSGGHPFTCDICGKSYTLKSNLISHQKFHTGLGPFTCDICGKNFTYKHSFSTHKKLHTGLRPYVCDVCGKNFTRKSILQLHMITHTGVRPFACDICEKTFIQHSHLSQHKLSHTGIHFVCDICGKIFNQRRHLTAHMKIHTGVHPYTCDICPKSFTVRKSLKIHKRIHTGERPYICDICGKNFICKSHLTAHKKTHAGERPYICDICRMNFICKSHLTAHKKTHAGLKRYCCCECDKRFEHKDTLDHHIRETHLPDCKNKPSVQEKCQKTHYKENEAIHIKFEENLPENLTVKLELNFPEFTDSKNMKDECLTIKNEVIGAPDDCNLEDIEGKFITPPKQMVENHNENLRKYIELLEGYMSGETQGSAQEIESMLQEVETLIKLVESSKSDNKNEPSNISNVNGTCKSVFSTNEDATSSSSCHNKEKAFKKVATRGEIKCERKQSSTHRTSSKDSNLKNNFDIQQDIKREMSTVIENDELPALQTNLYKEIKNSLELCDQEDSSTYSNKIIHESDPLQFSQHQVVSDDQKEEISSEMAFTYTPPVPTNLKIVDNSEVPSMCNVIKNEEPEADIWVISSDEEIPEAPRLSDSLATVTFPISPAVKVPTIPQSLMTQSTITVSQTLTVPEIVTNSPTVTKSPITSLKIDNRAKYFECTTCGKSYKSKSKLKIHIRRHTGEKPFMCPWKICGKKFYSAEQLSRHYPLHTGEKQYKCNFCSRSFHRSDSLHVHKRIHNASHIKILSAELIKMHNVQHTKIHNTHHTKIHNAQHTKIHNAKHTKIYNAQHSKVDNASVDNLPHYKRFWQLNYGGTR